MRKLHNWTDEEISFIRKYVLGHTWKETTEEFNRKFGCSIGVEAMKGTGGRYGIRTGRSGRYEKGNIPLNKGKHIQTTGRMAETQYRKGNRPQTWKPVGTESVRQNRRRGKKYIYKKVAEPNVWRMKHVLEWEKHNGKIPDGKIIIFANGDTLNTDISNLVMVSRQQHAIMNHCGIRGCNKEYMEAAANIAELKIKASERKKMCSRICREEEKRKNGAGKKNTAGCGKGIRCNRSHHEPQGRAQGAAGVRHEDRRR